MIPAPLCASPTTAPSGWRGWPRRSPRWRWSSSSAGRSTTSPAQTMDIQEAAFQLGLIGLVQFVPLFVLTPVSGWTADRLDRRYIARAVDRARTALRADPVRSRPGAASSALPILFGVAALLGVARAFAGPALGALAPNLVPREILPNAIALSSIAWQTGAIAGPAIGGYPLRVDAAPALRAQRRPVRLLAALPVHDQAGRRAPTLKPGSPLRADGRRPVLRPPQPAGARRDHASTCSRCCSAARPRCCRSIARDILQVGAGRARATCAPRRRSARR